MKKKEEVINIKEFWILSAILVIILVGVFIPKIDIKVIDKRPLQEFTCNCNCEYPQPKEEINWSNVEPVPFPDFYYENWTFGDFWINGSSWYDECRTCWTANTYNSKKGKEQ